MRCWHSPVFGVLLWAGMVLPVFAERYCMSGGGHTECFSTSQACENRRSRCVEEAGGRGVCPSCRAEGGGSGGGGGYRSSGGSPEVMMVEMGVQAVGQIIELFKNIGWRRSRSPARIKPGPVKPWRPKEAPEPVSVPNPKFREFEALVAQNGLSEEEHKRRMLDAAPQGDKLAVPKSDSERLRLANCMAARAKGAGAESAYHIGQQMGEVMSGSGAYYAVDVGGCPEPSRDQFIPPTRLQDLKLKALQKLDVSILKVTESAETQRASADEIAGKFEEINSDIKEFERRRDEAATAEDRDENERLANEVRKVKEQARKDHDDALRGSEEAEKEAETLERRKAEAEKCFREAADEDDYNECGRKFDVKGVEF